MRKKWLRRLGLAGLALLLLVIGLPFLLPVSSGGVEPSTLVDDPDGDFITLDGVRMYVEDKGPPAAPALVLVHGLFGSTESWRDNVPALVAAGYRVIAFDRPGFGLSDKPAEFNYAVTHQADVLATLLDVLLLENAVIIGHSAGGNVAAHFALRHPQRLTRLVLVDAAVLAGGPPPFVGRLVGLPPVWRWGQVGLNALFTRATLENALRGFYADASFMTAADYDTYWRAFQTPGWDVGLLGLTRDAVPNLTAAQIAGISTPTLLLWGEQDATTPLAQGEALARYLPDSTLVVLPGVAHQPFEENPAAFNAALLDYLAAAD
ncbi:MAG: alpha/beta hydrolase [Anaerolineae bacterium]|nr:alpha/beta hydrolase [Anaerolineae bacterium]